MSTLRNSKEKVQRGTKLETSDPQFFAAHEPTAWTRDTGEVEAGRKFRLKVWTPSLDSAHKSQVTHRATLTPVKLDVELFPFLTWFIR